MPPLALVFFRGSGGGADGGVGGGGEEEEEEEVEGEEKRRALERKTEASLACDDEVEKRQSDTMSAGVIDIFAGAFSLRRWKGFSFFSFPGEKSLGRPISILAFAPARD